MAIAQQNWPEQQILETLRGRARILPPLKPVRVFPELTDADILAALQSSILPGGGRGGPVRETVMPGESVCLVVSDHTRKTAANRILPLLLDEFRGRGCSLNDWFIMIASGIHRHPCRDELQSILGMEVEDEFRDRIFFHDPDDGDGLISVGTTRRGHVVRVSRRAMAADRRLLLGGVVFHYHAGFGGGRKSLVPGLASRETIAFTHSLTLDPFRDRIHPDVAPGRLDGNPVSSEMLEAAQFCKPDCIVNIVLDPSGRLVGVFAGEMDAAHRAACARAVEALSAAQEEKADLVVASTGGSKNWIQSHKALYNAHRAVKRGGQVVLLAPCPEGIGEESFRRWVRLARVKDIYAGLRLSPEVLGQTALSTRIRGRRTVLVTEMPCSESRELGMAVAPDIAAAIMAALDRLKTRGASLPTCRLMPNAMVLMPL